MMNILLYFTAEISFPRQLMGVQASPLHMITTTHNTTDVTPFAAPNDSTALHPASAALMLVRRHLEQSVNSSVTFSDHGMLLYLQEILIRPVHMNFTHKNGRAEPILWTNGMDPYSPVYQKPPV